MDSRKIQTGRRVCSVDGCDTRTNRGEYCEKHYMRMYRNGTLERTDLVPVGTDRLHAKGYYIRRVEKGHPMAFACHPTWAYTHRVIAYDKYGDGVITCHWCSSKREWAKLTVDHLDDNPKNNDPNNLVPACPTCNNQRQSSRDKRRVAMRSDANFYEHGGERLHISEWADRLGITQQSIRFRLKHWPLDRVFTEKRRS